MTRSFWIASFHTSDAAAKAVPLLRHDGHDVLEAYAPISDEALIDAVGAPRTSLRRVMLIAAIVGLVTGIAVQYYTAVIAYPINSGGRALASWPAFLLVIFELTIFFAAASGFIALMVMGPLTRLNAAPFAWPAFERASEEYTFLEVATEDADKMGSVLRKAGAVAVTERPA